MTSELDNWFGPKPNTEMPPAQPTHFARYPAVQSLCDVFLEEMDWGTDLYTIGQIAAGARDYALAIGHDTALLLRTIKKMKREELTIGSPRSCISIARTLLHSPDADSEAGRQKYLKGVDDE